MTARMRDRLAILLLLAIAVALLIGLYAKWPDFSAVEHVWSVVGPIVGAIVGFYFSRSRKDSE